MFSITPDSIFNINSHAYTAVATSSTACGLGMACDIWFLLHYNWVDLDTFIVHNLLTQPPPSHRMIISSLAAVPILWCVWLIHLLLVVLTHAHPLHVAILHLPYGLPRAHRIWCVACRCPGDWGASNCGDDPSVHRIWYASVCCICILHLEGWCGFDYSQLQRFSQWIKGLNFWITCSSISILNDSWTPHLYNPPFHI